MYRSPGYWNVYLIASFTVANPSSTVCPLTRMSSAILILITSGLFSRFSNPTRCRHGTASASDRIPSATAPPRPGKTAHMLSRIVDYN